jgi:amino acid transporter
VATRVQLVVAIVTVGVILIVDLVTIGKGGASGQALGAFTFGHTVSGGFKGVFYGIILGITSYIGFETAADFGEETANPRRAIPVAIIAATGFALVFYLLTTYATAIGFGVTKGADFGGDGFALKTVADKFVGGPLPQLIEIGAMLSAFIVCLACATAGARTLFAMGRERVLPSFFARTHPTYKTPVNATVTIAAVATVIAVVVGYGLTNKTLGQAFTVYALLATTGTLAIIVVYMALCLGGVAFFRRTRAQRFNPVLHGLVPVIGFVLFGASWYGSVAIGLPKPLNLAPWLALIILVTGVGVVLYLRSAHPERVALIGSILGEEGGDDDDDLPITDVSSMNAVPRQTGGSAHASGRSSDDEQPQLGGRP